VEGDEACDDQDENAHDGCVECAIEPGWACDESMPSDCVPRIVSMAGGGTHVCVVFGTGKMQCWGSGSPYVQHGYADWHAIGDDETPASFGPLRIDGTVRGVGTGKYHTFALLASGTIRGWGSNASGELGYGTTDYYEDASIVGDVDVGGTVTEVVGGEYHTCVLLTTGKVRCWGWGAHGHQTLDYLGDNETPAELDEVDVGGDVQQLAADWGHTCALLTTGAVRCWGDNAFGQLGYPGVSYVGDDETPASMGDVDVGGTVREITAGELFTCALLTTGNVRCWGAGAFLGYGDGNTIGDDEPPAAAGDVPLGVSVEHVVAGGYHTCVTSPSRTVHCWGEGVFGATGYATKALIGDDELPSSYGAVNVGGPVELLAAGREFTCAVLPGSKLRCWGRNDEGQLGYGHENDIGDTETPATAGFVDYF
jgi:cysteine-rich repeat protein